ncbi:hypothetical protein J7I97_25030 [Streptomyces sp. ISL-87]|uniref:hypothetical protein n=1 Tax=Streptomyces sp. ISL-87 TaxID=2819188 RepID=UPI001BE6E40B|nr:hypothetical protein [Streptomyces sp. ISL-87]MBT2611432.1 hypothetical protein [Streptomyces sp. ISL-87]
MSASSAGTPATKAARRARRRRTAAAPAAPAAAPVAKGTARATIQAVTGRLGRAQITAGITSAATALVPQDSKGRRWLAYNGSAAAAGHGALWLATGNPMGAEPLMAAAVHSVPNCGAFAVTCAVAYGGWKVGGILRGLLGPAARPAAALGAAWWGQGTAPLITDVMAATEPWSSMLLPLIAAGALAGICWWALDSRSAAWRAPVRWAARIPLATLALGVGLYAPGGTL